MSAHRIAKVGSEKEVKHLDMFVNDALPKQEDLFEAKINFQENEISFTLRKVSSKFKWDVFNQCMQITNAGPNFDLHKYYAKMLAHMIVHNDVTDSTLSEAQIDDLYEEIFEQLIPHVPTPMFDKSHFVDQLKKG